MTIGGEEGFLFETRAAEGGALGGLLDGARGDGEALGGVGVGETGLLDFKADAEGGLAEHFFHLRELGTALADFAVGLAAVENV
jgi:hypothetical protein